MKGIKRHIYITLLGWRSGETRLSSSVLDAVGRGQGSHGSILPLCSTSSTNGMYNSMTSSRSSSIEFSRGVKTSTKRVAVELVQHVEGLGRPGDLKYVTPGYARNFLVPNRLATMRVGAFQDGNVVGRGQRLRGLPFAATRVAEGSSQERVLDSLPGDGDLRPEEEQRESIQMKKERKKLENIVRKLTETTVICKVKVQEDGTLAKPIGPQTITTAIAKQIGIEIVEDMIDMEGETLDTPGDFLIPLKLIKGDGTKGSVQLRVQDV